MATRHDPAAPGTLQPNEERMTDGVASGSGVVHAPPTRVYGIIADYRLHHPHIVPPEYFRRVVWNPEPSAQGRVLEQVDASGFSVTHSPWNRLSGGGPPT